MAKRAITLLVALALGLGAPGKAAAQAADDGFGKIKPRAGGGLSPLTITGTSLAGLGGATIMASGICWLVAAGSTAHLDEDCPNKTCVEGSPGAHSLETARDAK